MTIILFNFDNKGTSNEYLPLQLVATSICSLFLLQYKLTVPKMGNVAELLAVLSKEADIPKDKVIMFAY